MTCFVSPLTHFLTLLNHHIYITFYFALSPLKLPDLSAFPPLTSLFVNLLFLLLYSLSDFCFSLSQLLFTAVISQFTYTFAAYYNKQFTLIRLVNTYIDNNCAICINHRVLKIG